jgi:hypothetical protein
LLAGPAHLQARPLAEAAHPAAAAAVVAAIGGVVAAGVGVGVDAVVAAYCTYCVLIALYGRSHLQQKYDTRNNNTQRLKGGMYRGGLYVSIGEGWRVIVQYQYRAILLLCIMGV